MKRLFAISFLWLFLAPLFAIQAQEGIQPRIAFSDVWARANADTPEDVVPAGEATAVYMRIVNLSDAEVALVGVSTPAAETIQLHQAVMDGDIMRMQPMTEAPIIAAGESLNFEMAGSHIMLLGAQPLVAGTAFPVTLTFSGTDGGTFVETIGVPVLDFTALPTPVPAIAIGSAWARPTAADETETPVTDVSAVYLQLFSTAENDDALVEVETSAAGIAEIHESVMDGDVMRMRPLEGGLPLPAGGEATLEPGGYHIMLMDLQTPLFDGNALSMTLIFASGAEITIGVPVYDRMMMDMNHE